MKKKLILVLTNMAMLICAVCLVLFNDNSFFAKANSNTYSLNLAPLSSNNTSLVSFNGNSIEFAVNQYSEGTFLKDSYIKNITPINGLESIAISFNTFDTNLTISYGWSYDEYYVIDDYINSNNQTYYFNNQGPSFFKIENKKNDPISISNIFLNYSCIKDTTEYTVSFYFLDELYSTIQAKVYSKIQEPSINESEYFTIDYWYTIDHGIEHRWFFNKDIVTGDVDVYAHVTGQPVSLKLSNSYYTVTYVLDNQTTQVTVGPNQDLDYYYPKKDDYLFAGWYETSDFSGNPFDFSKTVNSDVRLYGRWIRYEGDSYIYFEDYTSISLRYREDEAFYTSFVPLVDCYVSVCSSDSEAIIRLIDRRNNEWHNDSMFVEAGYEYWIYGDHNERNNGSVSASVSFSKTVPIGGKALVNDSFTTVNFGDDFSLPTVERDNLVFAGWFDLNGVQYTDENGTSIRRLDKSGEDAVLRPMWTPRKTTIQYQLNGGYFEDEGMIVNNVYENLGYSLYCPKKDGYTFGGFCLDENLTTHFETQGIYTNYIAEITLYAFYYKLEVDCSDFSYETSRKSEAYGLTVHYLDENEVAYLNFTFESDVDLVFHLYIDSVQYNSGLLYINYNGHYDSSFAEETEYSICKSGDYYGTLDILIEKGKTNYIGLKQINFVSTSQYDDCYLAYAYSIYYNFS